MTLTCKYKDENTYVMTCEKGEAEAQPVVTEPVAADPEPVVTEPVVEQVDTEEIEVPVVGEIEDEGYVEPLGESYSWYPDTVNYDNVVNYQYGKSSEFVASLTNPEEGITASDIVLITIIALSCLAITSSVAFLTTRAVSGRAKRKDFIQRNPR
ncbi:hypothetical protein IKG48_00230 [Candidatus Saccharibacteria bacterium]|nr:hypothetical protein [Candidatus Saccharibacteria bacterium]